MYERFSLLIIAPSDAQSQHPEGQPGQLELLRTISTFTTSVSVSPLFIRTSDGLCVHCSSASQTHTSQTTLVVQ